MNQGQEDANFWALFFADDPKPSDNQLYGNVNEWNHLMIDIEKANFVKSAPVVAQMADYRNIV